MGIVAVGHDRDWLEVRFEDGTTQRYLGTWLRDNITTGRHRYGRRPRQVDRCRGTPAVALPPPARPPGGQWAAGVTAPRLHASAQVVDRRLGRCRSTLKISSNVASGGPPRVSAMPPQLARVPVDGSLGTMLEAFDADGGVIVEGMVPRDTVDELFGAATAYAEGVKPGAADQGMGEEGRFFVGANTIRFSSLGRITPAYFDLLDNEVYAALADAVLLPNCGSYWVNTAQVMFIGPGESAQVLHRDADNWFQHVEPTWPDTPEVTISAMIGLEEVTEELGATRVVPGSHRWPELNVYEFDAESVPAELAPGDAFVYSGKVLHGGGANLTVDRWRRALHLSFVVGWLTPEEANALDYNPGELDDRSPRVQRLLGHRSYDPRPHVGGGLWLRHVRPIEDQA